MFRTGIIGFRLINFDTKKQSFVISSSKKAIIDLKTLIEIASHNRLSSMRTFHRNILILKWRIWPIDIGSNVF